MRAQRQRLAERPDGVGQRAGPEHERDGRHRDDVGRPQGDRGCHRGGHRHVGATDDELRTAHQHSNAGGLALDLATRQAGPLLTFDESAARAGLEFGMLRSERDLDDPQHDLLKKLRDV